MSYCLITGITGMLGRYLLRDALLAGRRVAVVVRSTPTQSGQQRVEGILSHWEKSLGRYLPRPLILSGDLTQPGLGLETSDRQWLSRNCDSVLHSAASLVFYADHPDGEPYRVNVGGTANLLELCDDVQIREFHHVSTAYVCGDVKGPVFEKEADLNAPFRNDYERSKALAEQMVLSAFGKSATVYRPSIIVGDSKTGFTSTFQAFYTPLHLAALASQTGGNSATAAFLQQLQMNPDDAKNFVPVDWVSSIITHMSSHPDLQGEVYHLTNPVPVSVRTIEQVIRECLGQHFNHLARSNGNDAPPNSEELPDSMEAYRSYFGNDPTFQSPNTERAAPELSCPRLDRATLSRLANYAIEVDFTVPRSASGPMKSISNHILTPLLKASSKEASRCDRSLRLQLTGPDGGDYRVDFYQGVPVAAEIASCLYCPILLSGPAATFTALMHGELALEHALLTGRIVLEASAEDMFEAERLIGSLHDMLCRQPLAVHAA